MRNVEFRTTFKIEPSPDKITYNDPVMFIGSCFASSIGSRLLSGHMPVMINPAGTVYNPFSVCNTLDTILSGKEYSEDDLYFHDGTYLSFSHYTDFSSDDPSAVLRKINNKSKEAFSWLMNAKFLFITFGTSRVFRWKTTGSIVSNCHKIPADQFDPELLSVDDIVTLWTRQLDRLNTLFPKLKIVFTVSPVRHWKDGAHGNQISKSILLLAVEELLRHPVLPQYFPAYELVNDDLRDYRFYSDDMLHPSDTAINYIWDAFSGCYLDSSTVHLWNEVVKITKACNHRLMNESTLNTKKFAEKMLHRIDEISNKVPAIDFSEELKYFRTLSGKE